MTRNNDLEDVKAIRFYRATGPHGFLSNLYKRRMVFEDKEFTCAETAYQFSKPKDRAVAEWLISAPKPHLCAVAAHALLGFDIRPDWNDIKVNRMKAVLEAKFSQNPDLKQALLNTGNAILIEDSKTDSFWGAGSKGTGQNTLGRLLMDVRQEFWETGILERMGIIPGTGRVNYPTLKGRGL